MERRRMFKAVAVLVALGYCSVLVYQGGVTFNFQEMRAVQVSDLSIESVKKSSVNDSENKLNNKITLDDIFISVRTSKIYEKTRLPVILKTWFQVAKKQTWIFTDTDNKFNQAQTNGHIINTNCSPTHERKHLCCKTSVEYDTYIASNKKWFCHFDDDNYVYVARLLSVLQKYDPSKEWYLGRLSIKTPVGVNSNGNQTYFWFATGGAGYCISRSLALKMIPLAGGGKFITMCEQIKFPDDVTMGFIIEHVLKTNMTFVPEFHSHYEALKMLKLETLKDQISFSYDSGLANVLNIHGFDETYDPTRFLSLHCYFYPHFRFCPR